MTMYDDPITLMVRDERKRRFTHGPVSIDDQDGPVLSVGVPLVDYVNMHAHDGKAYFRCECACCQNARALSLSLLDERGPRRRRRRFDPTLLIAILALAVILILALGVK